MNAQEILDKIFQRMQNVPPGAPFSESFAAYQETVKILDEALLKAYEKGSEDMKLTIELYKTEKQQKQN